MAISRQTLSIAAILLAGLLPAFTAGLYVFPGPLFNFNFMNYVSRLPVFLAVVASLYLLLAALWPRWLAVISYYTLPLVVNFVGFLIMFWDYAPSYRGIVTAPWLVFRNNGIGLVDAEPRWPLLLGLVGAVLVLSRLPRPKLPGTRAKYGHAKWARLIDLPGMGLNFKRGIVLGKLHGKLIRSDKPLSTLVIAPPGTGKSAGIVVPNLLMVNNSIVAFDLKGELYALTAEHRRKTFGSRVLLFDPESPDSVTFNPLSPEFLPEDDNKLTQYVGNISKVLIPVEEKRNKYFYEAAQSVFVFFTLYLLGQNPKIVSLTYVRQFIFSQEDIAGKVRSIIGAPDVSSFMRTEGNAILNEAHAVNQWAGIIGVVKNALDIFKDSTAAAVSSGKSDLSADTLRKENVSLYVRVRSSDAERLTPLTRLLFVTLTNQLISEMPQPDDQRVTFLLDEFARLPHIESIARLPEISRGFNVGIIFVAQDYGQIKRAYGPDFVSMLETNTEYKVILRQNNRETAEAISKLIGKRTEDRKTVNKNPGKEDSKSISEEGVSLVSEQDILALKSDECIIIVGGSASIPIKAKVPFLISQKKYNSIISEGTSG